MKWKNIKMRGKFSLAFGSVILLLVIAAFWAIFGISGIVKDADEVIKGNELRSELEEKYMQHLIWVKKLNDYMSSNEETELNIETNPHNCAFGKWYYGEGREQAESLVPGLAPVLTQMEDPHTRLHESAIQIEEVFMRADWKLSLELQEAKAEHILWLSSVSDAIDRGVGSGVTMDINSCAYGRWLNSAGKEKLLETSPELAVILDQISEQHRALHQSVERIAANIPSNPGRAKQIYRNTSMGHLNELSNKSDDIINWNNHHLEGRNEAVGIYEDVTQAMLASLEEKFSQMIDQSEEAILSEEVMISSARKTRAGVVIFGLSAVLIAGLLAYIITQSITSPLSKGIGFASDVARGNLAANVAIDQKDEVGMLASSLKNMVARISEIVRSILEGSQNIAAGSQQLSNASQQISSGANEQASSVEEISSSMEQMAANIQQNTDNAQHTEKLAYSANEKILESNKATQKLVSSMNRIVEKISLVNDIAFQTNILALNAAIEAARAGEHGKGFAVVAAEVRKLAEHSKAAAEEIAHVSEEGKVIADQAGRQLEELVPDIEKTAQMLQEIASASIEQNSGAGQINNAIQQLNVVTQRNAASAEELATSAEEMSAQAEQLRQVISWFKVNETTQLKSTMNTPKSRTVPQHTETPKKPAQGVELSLQHESQPDSDFESF